MAGGNNIFDEVLLKGIRSGHAPAREQSARDWYRNKASEYKKINETAFIKEDKARLVSRVSVGNCYMFFYNPKHKKTLPYYDRFPLVFPFRKVPGGFLGINLHYLPLEYRAKLMDALYDITNNTSYDDSTKLKLTYATLNGLAKFKYFKPCIKHYLSEHVITRFMSIHATEWDIALWLPTSRFVGASQGKVWADSKKIIRNA